MLWPHPHVWAILTDALSTAILAACSCQGTFSAGAGPAARRLWLEIIKAMSSAASQLKPASTDLPRAINKLWVAGEAVFWVQQPAANIRAAK